MATSQPITLIGTALSSQWNRQAIGRFLSLLVTHTTGAEVRSGVMGAFGDPLKVVSGGGRDLLVKPGTAVLATTATLGPLPIVVPTQLTVTCDTADGVNPRWDLVIVEVDDLGTADSVGNVRIVKGIPASNPQVPSTNWLDPSNPVARPLHNGGWFRLASCLVPSSGGGGSVTTINDLRPKTASAGGVIPVPGAWATPALAAALPPDTIVLDAAAVGGPKLLSRDSGTGLTRLDVPPIGMRTWADAIFVPSGVAYDMGNQPGREHGEFGPAYVALHANGTDVVTSAAGLYQIDVEIYMDTSHASAAISLKVNGTPVITSGIDAQGRANFGKVMGLSAGAVLNLQMSHQAGSERAFVYWFTVTRLA